MYRGIRRDGFTLPEILVTVTIVAVLAAVVVPSVVNQVSKGDQPSVASDLTNVRTGVTAFATDVRHFPSSFAELDSGSILHAARLDIMGLPFGADTANYHGPYVSTVLNGHVVPEGGVFQDSLHTNGNQICLRDSITTGGPSLVSSSQAHRIDSAFDAANGPTLGTVTWTDSTAPDQIKKGTLLVCLITYK